MPADVGGVMNDDLQVVAAACAGSDLAARLGADLALAERHLLDAARELRTTRHDHRVAPATLRLRHLECRREVAALRRLLDDIPTDDGGCHAQSA